MHNNKGTKNIAQQFCQASGARNLDVILSLFAEDIDWYIPGNEKVASWTGKRGHKYEVKECFQLLT